MSGFFSKMNDGGPFFTYPILFFILVLLVLIVLLLRKKADDTRLKNLIINLGWFALAWGFLGRTFGLIVAFDNIAAAGELSPPLLAEGLKMAILDPLMGIVAFLIARIGLIFKNLAS